MYVPTHHYLTVDLYELVALHDVREKEEGG